MIANAHKFLVGAVLLTSLGTISPATFAQTNPVPFINQPVSPTAVAPGGLGFTLTVNGAGFVPGSVVNWNSSSRVTTFVNKSQLTAAIQTSDISVEGTAQVTVVNPTPGGGTSNGEYVVITSPNTFLSFGSTIYTAGKAPLNVIAADLRGDGHMDVVTSNQIAGTIAVLLGNGDGTFQPPASYKVRSQPLGLAAGDFNGDGKLDLAVVNFGGNTISVLLGNGDGTFQPNVSYSTGGSSPVNVAVGDFNGDGKLDLAVTKLGGNAVAILLGNGDGTFRAHMDYQCLVPAGITVGDFNGDGTLDLAITNQGESTPDLGISILLGNGDGSFQSPVVYGTGVGNIANITTADLNGDRKLDLVATGVGGAESGGVSVLLGNGDGTFQTHVDYPLNGAVQLVATGDMSGDGKLDLIVPLQATPGAPGYLAILPANGDGTFGAAILVPIGFEPYGAAVGDFNNDGRLDVVVGNADPSLRDSTISVLLQQPITATSTTNLSSSLNPSSFGQSVTFTAAVISSGSGTPTGTVTFKSGSTTLGMATLSGGAAAFTTTTLAVGTSTITAVYSGDATNGASTSPALSQVVNKAATTISLASSQNPSSTGQSIAFTATVSSITNGTPTGSVAFQSGTKALGRAVLVGGVATISTTALATGSDKITVTYAGSGNFAGSSATLNQVVN